MSDAAPSPVLRLTNTLTRSKEPFRPIDPANVRMYACGPTVYDLAHIGNARPVIVFDVLFRLLRHLYGAEHVTYVRNVTDVDDKINARAAAEHPGLPLNEAIRRVTATTEAQFHEDVRALGVLTPADVNVPGQPPRMIEPRATEHIDEMRLLIDRLVASGHAYVAADHVLFDVPSMPDYGGLSRRPLDEMEAGARVDVAPYKRSPLDFVLWKPSGAGEPAWPSPAGVAAPGRPGWHIECSAMSWKHLGPTFDIHAGGLDLIFPHHENEIAQSRCAHCTPAMANYWLHNGFLQVEGEKMSKSLGNFVTIRDVLQSEQFGGRAWEGAVVRFAMLQTDYRQPIDWTEARLRDSYAELSAMLNEMKRRDRDDTPPSERFFDALADDLNTSAAITELRRLMRVVRRPDTEEDRRTAANQLHGSLRFLGFERISLVGSALQRAKERFEAQETRARELVVTRNAARAAKNWAESDRIRDELKAMGVQLKDNKDGTTTWEVAR